MTKLTPKAKEAISAFTAMQQAIAEACAAVNAGVLQVRPPDAFSVTEYAAEVKVPLETARGQLSRLVSMGTHEKIRVAIVDAGGCRKPILMYRKKPS